MKVFGERLKELRTGKGLTQKTACGGDERERQCGARVGKRQAGTLARHARAACRLF